MAKEADTSHLIYKNSGESSMNIEQAKAISIADILDKMNAKKDRQHGTESYYFAPWREEKTASLHVHEDKNLWYDFGIGIGGNTLALVEYHLKSNRTDHTIVDVLRWLKNMTGNPTFIRPVVTQDVEPLSYKLEVKTIKSITHLALVNYLSQRGILLNVAKTILKEVKVKNSKTGKSFIGLGLLNDDEGFEIRNPFLKVCAGPKALTFIRGKDISSRSLHIFEGFMDYLSIITCNEGKHLKDDVIILNSLACLRDATAYIKGHGYKTVFSWMDNDKSGDSATVSLKEFLQTESDVIHKPMNKIYHPSKDVNAWHMLRLGL